MVIGLLLSTLAHGAPIDAQWDLAEGAEHRWVVATAIDFPGHIFVRANRNRDVRARHLGLQAVVDCVVGEEHRGASDVACTVEAASWTGMTFTTEAGRLQPVLEELEAKLTGATVDLRLTADGHLRGVEIDLTPVDGFINRRTRSTDQFLRMVVVRALAPLDLRIPEGGFPTTETWVDSSSLTVPMPVTWGSSASGHLVHRAIPHDDARVVVQTVGEATLVPGGFLEPGTLVLDATLEGFTVFDHDSGRVSEAVFTTTAEPTATSGPLARPYRVQNQVRALGPDEAITLPPTRELEPPQT